MKGLTKSTFNFPNLQDIHKKTPLRQLGINRVLQAESGLYAYSNGELWIWSSESGDWETTAWPDDVMLLDGQLVRKNAPIKVDVYRNLHKACYSVRSREPGDLYGRVLYHLDDVLVWNAKFVVQEKGRAKVLKTKRKNVHAFVRGTYVPGRNFPPWLDVGLPVTYNPYISDKFRLVDGEIPIKGAELVRLSNKNFTVHGRLVYN